MLRVLDDYMETAERLLEATTYQERCNCVDELRRVKVKMEKALGEFDREVEENAKAIDRLQHKMTMVIGKFTENMKRQDEIEEAVEQVNVLSYDDYYTKTEVDAKKLASPYPLLINGTSYDGSSTVSMSVPTISRSGKTLVIK